LRCPQSLRGLAIQFSKTGRPCFLLHHQLPTPPPDPPAAGARFLTAVRGCVSRPLVPARSRPLQQQGGAHVAKRLRPVKHPASRRSPALLNSRIRLEIQAADPGRRDRPPCFPGPRWPRAAPRGRRERRGGRSAGTPRSRLP